MLAVLATRARGLMDKLNSIAFSCVYDEKAIAQVEFAAGHLKNTEPLTYHQILGICASFREDLDGLRAHFAMAKKIAPLDKCVTSNYAFCLLEMGFVQEGIDELRNAPSELWTNPEYLRDTFDQYVRQGLVSSALALGPRFHKLNIADKTSEVSGVEEFLVSKSITEDDIYAAVSAAHKHLCSLGKRRFLVYARLVGSNEQNTRLVYRFSYPSNADDAFNIETSLQRSLDEQSLKAVDSDAISFYIMPVEGGPLGDNNDRAA